MPPPFGGCAPYGAKRGGRGAGGSFRTVSGRSRSRPCVPPPFELEPLALPQRGTEALRTRGRNFHALPLIEDRGPVRLCGRLIDAARVLEDRSERKGYLGRLHERVAARREFKGLAHKQFGFVEHTTGSEGKRSRTPPPDEGRDVVGRRVCLTQARELLGLDSPTLLEESLRKEIGDRGEVSLLPDALEQVQGLAQNLLGALRLPHDEAAESVGDGSAGPPQRQSEIPVDSTRFLELA